VMGATKLLAEKYLQSMAATSQTTFCAVRFGNVLNSAGSVVPTFRKQIEAGGPITVTHPEMTRFFMTIPEAVQLVLQAGAIGHSGEVLILDMGEPVKIVDLAKDLILMSGLKYPDDIDIVFTGMRPGEKLFEELFYAHESGSRKVHEKIYSGCPEIPPPLPLMLSEIRRLEEAAYGPRDPMLEALRDIVAGHSDSAWTPSRLKIAA
jgi:FlaA1/EpsC-like NDP-sugar epimerase